MNTILLDLSKHSTYNTHLLCTLDEARLRATAARDWTLEEKTERGNLFTWAAQIFYIFYRHVCLNWIFSQQSLWRLLNYLLPRGDKPLDFALFLAAFDETGFLTGGFRQARTHTVCQRVCLGTWVCARTQHCPLPHAVATLSRTLPNKQ